MKSSPTTNAPAKIGFTEFAETWNGRLAMIGFVAAIVTELVSGKGVLAQLGLM
jgi:Chlorophyll A-B binding protein